MEERAEGSSPAGLVSERSPGRRLPERRIAHPDSKPPQAHRAPRVCAERESLYADMQPLVRHLLHRYGQDPELRQDLEGEIYCRFCQLLEAYDPRSDTWKRLSPMPTPRESLCAVAAKDAAVVGPIVAEPNVMTSPTPPAALRMR